MKLQFTLRSATALLMHNDDILAADELERWRKDPANKQKSRPGDDRTPPWTWMTYLYHDGEFLAMPSINIMVCLRGAAAKVLTGKRQQTFKEMSQSGLFIPDEYCEFLVNGKQIKVADLEKFKDEDFPTHLKQCEKLGFKLYAKRARIGQSKHIRVRPRFDNWTVRGSIEILTDDLNIDRVQQFFDLNGGIGDWRPSSPVGKGQWGQFTTEVVKV